MKLPSKRVGSSAVDPVVRAKQQEVIHWIIKHADEDADSVVLTDATSKDNPIVAVTGAWSTMCGFSREEALGRNCRLTQGALTDRSCIAAMGDAVRAGRACKAQLLNYRKSGEVFFNLVTISPIDFRGKPICYMGLLKVRRSTCRRWAGAASDADGAWGLACSRRTIPRPLRPSCQ